MVLIILLVSSLDLVISAIASVIWPMWPVHIFLRSADLLHHDFGLVGIIGTLLGHGGHLFQRGRSLFQPAACSEAPSASDWPAEETWPEAAATLSAPSFRPLITFSNGEAMNRATKETNRQG